MVALVLLDRDGVINHDRAESVRSVDEFVMIDGAAEAIASLNRANIKTVLVSNQSVVGKGIITQAELDAIHAHMQQLLKAKAAHLDAIYVCTDHPDTPTDDRKPAAGMVLRAMRDAGVSAQDTIMIGDALRDIQAGKKAGCHCMLVRTGKGRATQNDPLFSALQPVHICDDLADAVAQILGAV